ncbi:hypothetical protein A2U01_0068820, partial [Trifolium medium]|nr:hypothetical protein [Trifolium medium]
MVPAAPLEDIHGARRKRKVTKMSAEEQFAAKKIKMEKKTSEDKIDVATEGRTKKKHDVQESETESDEQPLIIKRKRSSVDSDEDRLKQIDQKMK